MACKWMYASIVAVFVGVLCAPWFLPNPPFLQSPSHLPTALKNWFDMGQIMQVNGHNMFYLKLQCSNPKIQNPPTFALIHGFPSSSFEYHKVIDDLRMQGNVILHDHVGFGLSDKPESNFTYSLSEAAENTLAVWRKAGIKDAHVVAHDMGDSVLTEILARRFRGMLPDYFEKFFLSVTFSNGGMKYSQINFRLSQILLSNVYLGSYFAALGRRFRIAERFTKQQILTVWGPSGDLVTRDKDIDMMWELIEFGGGAAISDKTMYYLWDRAHFEYRWFAALQHLDIRVRFVWSDSDAVSPTSIPIYFEKLIPHAELDFVEGAGHFFMLEKPLAWIEQVIKPLV